MIRIVRKTDFKTTEWSGGKTSEIFIWPVDGNYTEREFDWRLSSATVDVPESDFTSLEGFDRYISVLEGELDLTHEDGVSHIVSGQKVYHFSGGIKTHSVGKARDFNLIYKTGMDCEMGRKSLDSGQNLLLEVPKCGFLGVFIVSGTADVVCGNSEYFGIVENNFLFVDSLDDEKIMDIYAEKTVDLIICKMSGK